MGEIYEEFNGCEVVFIVLREEVGESGPLSINATEATSHEDLTTTIQ